MHGAVNQDSKITASKGFCSQEGLTRLSLQIDGIVHFSKTRSTEYEAAELGRRNPVHGTASVQVPHVGVHMQVAFSGAYSPVYLTSEIDWFVFRFS